MEKFNINNISNQNKQFELFGSNVNTSINFQHSNSLKIKGKILAEWRDRIHNHQFKISKDTQNKTLHQTSLPIKTISDEKKIDPFSLQPLSLNFWRTNQYIHNGPAMYFVIDTMGSSKIILYIGETNSANKRWKGEHDCKNYLINYKEALSHNNLSSHQDIRFFLDVPKEVKLRRKLEQQLIYLWLPPFNKETRNRWATTFTNN
ncbi:Cyanobacteria-specific protein containing UvrC-like endonuclease domain [Prochlorococcus marinus str. MIT 9201]|uniref:Cyanobacteria-specific protein containing UvrC-like endonuclease domain n=1 Tax=Prochlorococcus marinus str. MIT 9201 TaxID=93057 RepID=A0A0A2A4T7_PROMR|nr:hypothetical protein [Prochlorococcus marinus]KGF96580.1 Cyanobacteria-specific protein containing UvrC-like endonuclease domain [Prochlorococcus marinus str. MIT 9201]